MGTSSQVESVKAAKNQHRCDWCPEKIEAGESYKRYRWFSDDGAAFVKMHPECYDAMLEVAHEEGGQIEFSLHDSPRGCSCGGSGACNGCKTHNDLGNRRAAFGASELTDVLCGNGSEVGAGGTAMKGKQ